MGEGVRVAPTEPAVRTGGMTDLGRAHTGPMPGSYIITVELPPETDPDLWYGMIHAMREFSRLYIPGDIFVHGQRVMKGMGKHSTEDYPQVDGK